jgi:hypothetical protein
MQPDSYGTKILLRCFISGTEFISGSATVPRRASSTPRLRLRRLCNTRITGAL